MSNQFFPTVFSAQELEQIKIPVLLLVGEQERLYQPRALIRAAQKLMPKIETAIVKNAHHIAALSQPDVVNRHILKFLSAAQHKL